MKKTLKVHATTEGGTEDAWKRKAAEGEGEVNPRTPSWVSGSDRASMIGDVRSLRYEVRFEQPVWREEGEEGEGAEGGRIGREESSIRSETKKRMLH